MDKETAIVLVTFTAVTALSLAALKYFKKDVIIVDVEDGIRIRKEMAESAANKTAEDAEPQPEV